MWCILLRGLNQINCNIFLSLFIIYALCWYGTVDSVWTCIPFHSRDRNAWNGNVTRCVSSAWTCLYLPFHNDCIATACLYYHQIGMWETQAQVIQDLKWDNQILIRQKIQQMFICASQINYKIVKDVFNNIIYKIIW